MKTDPGLARLVLASLLLVFASNRGGKVRGETNVFVADWVEPPAGP